MKNNKGIVLIALIVTIVVMIIIFRVTMKQSVESEIIENAEKANNVTEGEAILEHWIEARSLDQNLEADILETAQNFVRNNEKSDIKYKVFPDPLTDENYYKDKTQVIVIVQGQVNYYRYTITKSDITYDGIGDKAEIEMLKFSF